MTKYFIIWNRSKSWNGMENKELIIKNLENGKPIGIREDCKMLRGIMKMDRKQVYGMNYLKIILGILKI